MPTIVGILTFMSMKNFMLIWVEHEKSFITSGSVLHAKNNYAVLRHINWFFQWQIVPLNSINKSRMNRSPRYISLKSKTTNNGKLIWPILVAILFKRSWQILTLPLLTLYYMYPKRTQVHFRTIMVNLWSFAELVHRGSYTRGHTVWNLWNESSASLIFFLWNDHECKILSII